MAKKSFYEMSAASVYELLVKKAERNGRTRDEVDAVFCWLLGYTQEEFVSVLKNGTDYASLFQNAPAVNPRYTAVTGVVCGIRVEEIEEQPLRLIRCADKMVDELARGKKMEKILRADDIPATVDEYIASFDERQQTCLKAIRSAILNAIPDTKEILSWGMPTYWKNHNIIHFAGQKNHIGIYPGGEAPEVFAEKLKGYEFRKGTIRIPYSNELPLDLISEIAKWCRIHND